MHVDSGKGGETERGPESSVDTKEDELEWERERKRAGWVWRRREGAEPLVAPPVNLRVRVVASIAVAGVEVAKAAWEGVEEEKIESSRGAELNLYRLSIISPPQWIINHLSTKRFFRVSCSLFFNKFSKAMASRRQRPVGMELRASPPPKPRFPPCPPWLRPPRPPKPPALPPAAVWR